MNEVKVFQHDMFGEIRVTDQDGTPWFIAKDVCDALELVVGSAMQNLDDDEKSKIPNKYLGSPGGHDSPIINESGMYSLILRSRKPEAKAFKKWVTSEVLPSIRKSGGYLSPEMDWTIENIQKVLDVAKDERKKRQVAEIRENIANKKVIAADEKIDKLQPLADMYKQLVSADGYMLMRVAAKVLGFKGMGQNNLYAFLRTKKVIMGGKTEPYQKYVDSGLFVVKQKVIDYTLRSTTYVTAKGLASIHRALEQSGYEKIKEKK